MRCYWPFLIIIFYYYSYYILQSVKCLIIFSFLRNTLKSRTKIVTFIFPFRIKSFEWFSVRYDSIRWWTTATKDNGTISFRSTNNADFQQTKFQTIRNRRGEERGKLVKESFFHKTHRRTNKNVSLLCLLNFEMGINFVQRVAILILNFDFIFELNFSHFSSVDGWIDANICKEKINFRHLCQKLCIYWIICMKIQVVLQPFWISQNEMHKKYQENWYKISKREKGKGKLIKNAIVNGVVKIYKKCSS